MAGWRPHARPLRWSSRLVPDEVVAALQKRLQPYEEQVLHKAEWLYRPGDAVEIIAGPFVGLEAIFQKGIDGKERVQVLLDILGAWNRVELGTNEIAPFDERKRG